MVSGPTPGGIQTHANTRGRDLWRLRMDLHFCWVDGIGDADGYWVVNDPLAGEWFCLSRVEKRLLELADGCRSIGELCQLAAATIRPLESSLSALLSFYTQARRKGLLLSVGGSGPIEQTLQSQAAASGGRSVRAGGIARWVSRLVAFRLPGINPNRWLGPANPPTQSVVPTAALLVPICLAVIAIALLVGRFDVFAAEVSLAIARRDPVWLVCLLITIAVVKSVHELAHVLACRRVGAECRELGVMLLFATPCLYCDVSDLWRVPRRGERVLVSAAGMLAELCLAGLATILWAATGPSVLHDLALVVMVVGGVSTVLINGNPLLRYDGYFMLADWIGVPNLAQRASGVMRHAARRIVWGVAAGVRPNEPLGRAVPPSTLLLYAAASALYRVFVVGVITLLIYHASIDVGVGWLGAAFAGTLLGSMLMRAIGPVLQPPDSDSVAVESMNAESSAVKSSAAETPQRWWHHSRAVAVVSCIFLLLVVGMVIPFPRQVVVPMLVVAADQQELLALESGRIIELAESGSQVTAGQVLVRLQNDALDDQLASARAELDLATALVAAWESRKGSTGANPTALALAVKRRDAAERQHRVLARRVDRLTLVARSAGRFVHSIPRPVDARDRRLRCGQWVPRSTLLGWVGHPIDRNGMALIDQDQVDLVRAEQVVRVRHASIWPGRGRATVRRVARAARESIPPELSAGDIARIDGATSQDTRTRNTQSRDAQFPDTLYWVRITLDEPLPLTLPPRSVVSAEIHVDSISVWNRLRRFTASQYRGL
ncbi:Peptidase family M50 [Stieleria maiorica]|uniref:Peptidase family M50 n=1 Tax=Stieleria maiorica TaxID=2795974 RepID=A0A5B9MJ97_9BACT|nr:hypothetical protein [Stieleria maiorica]QEF99714.1 Peptidase family M50 [Stieleria maiorica]